MLVSVAIVGLQVQLDYNQQTDPDGQASRRRSCFT